MLPFLNSRKQPGIMMAAKAKGGAVEEGEEGQPNYAMLSVAEDLLSAIKAGDAALVAEALEAAIECCDSDVELEHLGPPSEG